jgi:hypothetical protein
MSLTAWTATSEDELQRTVPGCVIVSKGWTAMGGLRAREIVYTATDRVPSDPQRMATVKVMQVGTVRYGTAYVLTYMALVPYYAPQLESFREVVKSVKWSVGAHPVHPPTGILRAG